MTRDIPKHTKQKSVIGCSGNLKQILALGWAKGIPDESRGDFAIAAVRVEGIMKVQKVVGV